MTKTETHLSDVEFRGETIYFIVLDRFNDGNKHNVGENQELNDFSHQDWKKYWGGDLQGLYDKLDYLQGLGVTAIWCTPLFEQIEGDFLGLAPSHGYWARDFKRINARWVNEPSEVRLFTRNDTIFDKLIAELHRRGMKFILDIVCNHSSPATSVGKGKLYDDGKPIADFDNDKENWYHHYGGVTNWEDDWQVKNCELAGIATFNENNTAYRRYIKDAIKLWLDKGVDALRVDTVKHMPVWFWQEFNSDILSHKPDTFVFGEYIGSHPGNQVTVDFANHSGMTILDFGLAFAIRQCLGEDNAAGFGLVQDIFNQDYKYRGANELVTFFENHDMPRLQSMGVSDELLPIAVALIMTSRGVPCLYYGCEQYLHDDMDHGMDPYNRPMMAKWDVESPIYKMVKRLAAERAKNPAIQWGGQWQCYISKDVYAYSRRYHDSFCFTVLNKGEGTKVDSVKVQMPDGQYQCILSGRKLAVKNGEIAPLELQKREILVLSYVGKRLTGKTIIHIQVNGVKTQPGETVVVIGDCPELGEWDITKAWRLEYINENMWFGEIAFNESAGKSIAYKLAVLSPDPKTAPHRENRTSRRRPIGTVGVVKWRDVWEE